MSTRPYIKRDFGRIVTETPFDRLWVDAIKYVVPMGMRAYESANVWSFGPSYYSCVRDITIHFFGSKVIDSTGGVPEPQTSAWKERWAVWKSNHQSHSESRAADDESRKSRPFDEELFEEMLNNQRQRQEQRRQPPPQGKIANAYASLFVTADAPKEVIVAAWRALNAVYRKDDPDGKKNHEILARINGAHAELKKLGRI